MGLPGDSGLEEFGETYGIGLETVRGLICPWPDEPLGPWPWLEDELPPLKSCCLVISLKCLKKSALYQVNYFSAKPKLLDRKKACANKIVPDQTAPPTAPGVICLLYSAYY